MKWKCEDCRLNGLPPSTFFIRRNPELSLPLTTNNRSRHDTQA